MAKKSRRRRRPGRPATGRDPVVTVRLTPQLRRALELLMQHHRMTRSAAIRCLLNAGIDHSYSMIDPKRNVDYLGPTPGLERLSRTLGPGRGRSRSRPSRPTVLASTMPTQPSAADVNNEK